MSFYKDWGYTRNPFETTALPANSEGDKLLVGRNSSILKLRRRLESSQKIPTIEGLNGVGKTSLVNVALYRAKNDAIRTKVDPFLIPCRTVFQLDGKEDAGRFKRRVLLEVAQTLLEAHRQLPVPAGRTRSSQNNSVAKFINSAQIKSFSAGAWIINGGVNFETNTGFGYEESGFEKALLDWLLEIFPKKESGGVVCVIDNLELLQTSSSARETMESLRDTLFSIHGVRWILCGALGIVHGIVSSPRLDGRLQRPIVIEDLGERDAPLVFRNRVRTFRESTYARLPLTEANFVELFDIMRGNIRSVLSECDEFCAWVADQVEGIDEFEPGFFEDWLEKELEDAFEGVRSELRPRALEVFETACQFEVFSPSDCHVFGYDKPEAMRPQIRALEEVGLLVSSVDDTDKRRRTIQVTPKGWKVRAFLDFFGTEHD